MTIQRSKNFTLFLLLLLVVGLFLFLPLSPAMPAIDADGSWPLVMNYAIVNHWVFGRDIIFTYGFFAYLGTFEYDPILFPYLMMFWFLFLSSMIFYVGILFEGQQKNLVKILLALIFLSCVISYSPSIFFTMYPLIFGLYVLKREKTWDLGGIGGSALLGIITLIKFSFSLLALIVILMVTILDFKKKKFPLKLICYGVVILLSFVLNHQPLALLPDFIANLLQIISGYNASMGLGGTRFFPIVVYIFMAVFLCKLLFSIHYYESKTLNRCAVFLWALSFFVVFKATFVRADAHIFYAFVYELSAIFLLMILYLSTYVGTLRAALSQKKLVFLMLIAFIFMIISKIDIIPNPVKNLLSYPHLAAEYQATLLDIKQKYPLPLVEGTVDIYSVDQTILLANNLHYDPRPIFQSYSAYTPKLLEFNRAHLLSAKAPDNIFFSMQPMDNRYPSIEDGLSWPVLLSHYELYQNLGKYLWLTHKQPRAVKEINISPLGKSTYLVGATVVLPKEMLNKYLWLQITFPESLASRVVSALFKPVQTYLTVTLMNGQKIQYRFIEGMGSGFLFSPLVQNTAEFGLLYSPVGRRVLLKNKQIQSFSISYHGWQAFFTPKTYQVKFNSINF